MYILRKYTNFRRLRQNFSLATFKHSPKMASNESYAPASDHKYPLEFNVLKKCSKSKARCSLLKLPHATLETPQFMPVGFRICGVVVFVSKFI
jgi:hypothetical protein